MSITTPQFQDILNSVTSAIAANTVVTAQGQVVNPDFSVGSFNLTFAEVIALALDLVYAQIENVYAGSFVTSAVGPDLDSLGDLIGYKRIQAGNAQATATINTATPPINVPINSTILIPDSTGVPSIPYLTQSALTVTGSSGTVLVQAVNAGSAGTVTTTVTGYLQAAIAGVNSITVAPTSPAVPGTDTESDDSYRSALMNNSIINKGTTANIIDQLGRLTTSSGLFVKYATVYVDGSFVYYDGGGKLGFYIQSVSNSTFTSTQQSLITGLIASLRSAGIQLYPNATGWATLTSTPVNITVTIVVADTTQSTTTSAAVQTAVSNYLNNLTLGADVIYSEVISAIMSTPNVTNQSGLTLNYLASNYTGDITVAANILAGPGTFNITVT